MKRIIVWMAAAAVVVSAVAVTAQQQSKSQRAQTKSQRTEVREQRHEERVKRRAERLAAFEKHMDSIILSRNFQFNPSSMQRQPAGPVRQLINPNFTVGFWDGTVDVCLPYIKGYVPPYYYTVLNYVLPSVEGYRAEQTNEGWIVTFSTTLFSPTITPSPSTSTRRREAPTSPFRRSGTIPYSTPALLRRCIDPSAF